MRFWSHIYIYVFLALFLNVLFLVIHSTLAQLIFIALELFFCQTVIKPYIFKMSVLFIILISTFGVFIALSNIATTNELFTVSAVSNAPTKIAVDTCATGLSDDLTIRTAHDYEFLIDLKNLNIDLPTITSNVDLLRAKSVTKYLTKYYFWLQYIAFLESETAISFAMTACVPYGFHIKYTVRLLKYLQWIELSSFYEGCLNEIFPTVKLINVLFDIMQVSWFGGGFLDMIQTVLYDFSGLQFVQ